MWWPRWTVRRRRDHGPGNVRTVDYIPLTQLLPTCSAVIHRGAGPAALRRHRRGAGRLRGGPPSGSARRPGRAGRRCPG
ncbi:nucleotide disphospho-sugar-binding domain-containing protein, partial [Streptomyces cyaneofuscatus]